MKSLLNILLLGLTVVLSVSCTSEEAKLKNALITSIPESVKSEYRYESHVLLETLLKSNLTDSISSLRAEIITNETLMQMDSTRLADIQSSIDECKELSANTMYFLKSSYDQIIDDYEDMADDIIEKIEGYQNEIDLCQSKIDFLSNAMSETESPIVFYKVKHTYRLRGMYRDTTVYINSKYEIVK